MPKPYIVAGAPPSPRRTAQMLGMSKREFQRIAAAAEKLFARVRGVR